MIFPGLLDVHIVFNTPVTDESVAFFPVWSYHGQLTILVGFLKWEPGPVMVALIEADVTKTVWVVIFNLRKLNQLALSSNVKYTAATQQRWIIQQSVNYVTMWTSLKIAVCSKGEKEENIYVMKHAAKLGQLWAVQ